MHNTAYDEYDGADGAGVPFLARVKSGISTAIGAVAALAIIFTMGVWFYRLGERDAQNVPIIRAAAGPAKEQPEDPGGLVTPHQGIKSYALAEGPRATASAAMIAPAAPEPKPEDVAMGALTTTEASPAVAPEPATRTAAMPVPSGDAPDAEPAEAEPGPTRPDAELAETPAAPAEEPTRVAVAPTDAVVAPVRPERAESTSVATPEPAAEENPTVPDEIVVIPGATQNAPAISPTAPRRPGNLISRNEAAAREASTDETDLVAAAATSPFQIQLAADPSKETVRQMWSAISKANQDVLRGRALTVQSTVSGGTTFYRLRVGPFSNRAEAVSVCRALKARDQDCIVARNS